MASIHGTLIRPQEGFKMCEVKIQKSRAIHRGTEEVLKQKSEYLKQLITYSNFLILAAEQIKYLKSSILSVIFFASQH